jgi:ABC-type polysaccharide/polyol phosphate transport system ATPase subunit
VPDLQPGAVRADGVSRRFRVREEPTLTLRDLLVRRRRPRREVQALRDVSVRIEPGEAVGLIGRNGSGKTTLLRLIAGIFAPTSGTVAAGGSVGSLLELGAGFHPDFTGRENVYLNGAIHGLKRDYIRDRMSEIVEFAELEDFIDLPVRTYSAGMYVRLGFAVATHLRPDILLLDEVFAVGDEAFQRKCFERIFDFKRAGGTIVFVSHDAAAVARLCERAVLLNEGRVEVDGPTPEALARYHRLLAVEHDPAERRAGLREWGSGEIRVTRVTLRGANGEERREFAAGEPLEVEVELAAESDLPAPVLSLELRDNAGTFLGGSSQPLDEEGWGAGAGERTLAFELDRLPLAEGRFAVGIVVSDESGGRLYHHLDAAADLVVRPEGPETRGALLLEGRWSARAASEAPKP